MRRLLVGLIGVSLVLDIAAAQGISGSYATADGTFTLTLAQTAGGEVTGTLSSADFTLTGRGVIDDGTVLGTMTGGGVAVYFAAELSGNELQLTLYQPDANNQPDYQSGQTISFTRTEAGSAAGAAGGVAAGAGERVALDEAFKIAFGLPRVVAVNVHLSRTMVVEAVYAASAHMGQVVYHGTLTMTQMGVQYLPQPSDRLVVNLGSQTHEFVVHQAQGNDQALNASAWVLAPHLLRYTHRLPGQAEAQISARYDGSRFEVALRGWYTQNNRRYDLNLQAAGQSAGVRDYGGQDTQTIYDLTGGITGGGLSLEVNERHASTLVAATSTRTLPSRRGSASRINATINNTLRFAGNVYQLQNVQVQTDQKTKGGNTDGGMTGLSGQLLRDGQVYGRFFNQAGQPMLETHNGTVALGAR